MIDALVPVQDEGFTIVPVVGNDAISVSLAGTCDSQTLPTLERFLQTLHREATRLGMKRLVLECENLYFMNSASVKCFVTWLMKVKVLPPSHRYGITVRTNPSLAWQARSFGAIGRSAPDVMAIDQ
jgi:hypothetical protein